MLDYLVNGQPLLLLGLLFTISFGLNILLSRKLNLPHVVFYLFVGFFAGNFLVPAAIYSPEIQGWFHFVEIFALGLIGFQIGTELHFQLMKKDPKLITILLFSNVAGAFILTYIIMLLATGNNLLSIMLAALATSTAPATTVGVIKKLQAKGWVTTRVQWILAFDDVVSVAIVEAFLVIAVISLGGNPSVVSFVLEFGREIGLAIVIGLILGFILNYVVERMPDDDNIEIMELTFGVVMLGIGIAEVAHTSAITTAMIIGALSVNLGGDNYKESHDLIDILMSPILALFFILIGAKVTVGSFSPFPWLAIIYFVVRAVGKIFGTYFGAYSLGIDNPRRSGLGLALIAQGGIVLALASRTSEIFISISEAQNEPTIAAMGNTILSVVIISTILSEVFGALGTDKAIKMNDEDFNADYSIFKSSDGSSH